MSGSVRVSRGLVVKTMLGAACLAFGVASGAAAQTTITLTDANDTTLRGGSHANTNYGGEVLVTRASGDPTYARRTLLKFDTHNTVPAGSPIRSASLTLTVRGGNADTRRVAAYCVTHSFDESRATWKLRKSETYWTQQGGDTAHLHAVANVSNEAGSKVTFDVTGMVQEVVNGAFGSRYARFLLIDLDSPARSSYKEYYNSETGDASARPRLVVTYGASSTAPYPAPAPAPAPSGSTLRMLHWNIHHGVGTDGRYDLDRIATWIAKTGAQVVSLNECEYYTGYGYEDQPARFEKLLEAKTGKNWHRAFATSTGATKGYGNALLSIYPLESTDSYQLSYGRSVIQASIVVNGRTVNVFSTHLDNDSSSQRATQMNQLKSFASTYGEQRLMAGDFNTSASAGEIARMTGTYDDAWAEAVIDGTAVAFPGNTGQTRNSRIDYVFVSEEATRLGLKGARVFDTRDSDGDMPSDHRPLVVTFEVR